MVDLSPKTKKLLVLAGKVFTVMVLAGVLLWFLVINPLLIRAEKQRFESASAELEKLANQIQQKIGTPILFGGKNSCGRSNLKLDEGPLICNVKYFLEYNTTSVEQSNQLLSTLGSMYDSPLREGPLAKSTVFTDRAEKSVQIIYQDIGKLSDFSCVQSYEYYPTGNAKSDGQQVKIVLNCGGPARAEHYPVED